MNSTPPTFQDLGLSEILLTALLEKGFTHPTPIQAQSIPLLLSSDTDFIGQAQTGTGKTAAFGLPILEVLDHANPPCVKALVLAPTRELAIQIANELDSLRGKKQIEITAVYGGQAFEPQFKALKKADIVVGTPGRLLDHIKRKTLRLDELAFLVLDEADEMLNMGFKEDIEAILSVSSKEKRVFLFSATMPPAILSIAKTYMRKYETVSVAANTSATNSTEQFYLEVHRDDKFESLIRVIEAADDFYGIIFCRTKIDVDAITRQLMERGYSADGLHGDISQSQRIKILDKFKNRQLTILVATDVASRGIDVQDLSHVINFAIPQDPETYVHRIGRTGRAGKNGIAITIITSSEYSKITYIQRISKQTINAMTIPSVHDLIEAKKVRFEKQLAIAIEHHDNPVLTNFAEELLKKYDVQTVVSAMLQSHFKDSLEESRYRVIDGNTRRSRPRPETSYRDRERSGSDRPRSGDRRERSSGSEGGSVDGRTRLFVAKGKADGFTVPRLIQLIENESQVPGKLIRDVQLLDKFSFISVPTGDSQAILKAFQSAGENRKPLVTRAKAR